ncbi:MAG: hypothetical protein HOV81_23285 [Kofleriaceae bacterium]|nr:hypothetical protein [Kofleriaceae bacterium]
MTTQAGMLTCPHCGAGAKSTDHHCSHCNTELMMKACPRCLARSFSGHKHCPGCGAELDLVAKTPGKELPCPRCTTPLHARLVGDIVIDECGSCMGLFLDQVAIRRVIADRQQARAEALLGALPNQVASQIVKPGQKMYVKCPVCTTMMNRKLFAMGAGVIVDVCRDHGTFFDTGELPRVIEFVMQGGLEKAEKKEIERRRAQLAVDRARGTPVIMPPVTDTRTPGSALVDILFSLLG